MGAMNPMLPQPYRIRQRLVETAAGDVFTLVLSGEGIDCRPGQFNMLYHFGAGEVPISVSGDTGEQTLVHTVRAVGGITRLLQELEVGATVGLRGPYGSGWPLERAEGRDLLLIAGGLGMAPLRPVVYHAIRHRPRFRRVFLLYGARDPASVLYPKELQGWRSRGDLAVEITVDRGGPGWAGHIGVVTRLIERAGFDPANALAMVCGPEPMMRFSTLALAQRGLPQQQIYLSLERNMKCAIGHCGHCQLLPHFICKDGPVFRADRIRPLLDVGEL